MTCKEQKQEGNLKGEIKVGYGGSDCSCRNIEFDGADITLNDLKNMMLEAQKLNLYKVCIQKYQFNSLIGCIKNIKESH